MRRVIRGGTRGRSARTEFLPHLALLTEEKEARMEEERKQAEQKMRMASLRKRASSRKVMGFVNS